MKNCQCMLIKNCELKLFSCVVEINTVCMSLNMLEGSRDVNSGIAVNTLPSLHAFM